MKTFIFTRSKAAVHVAGIDQPRCKRSSTALVTRRRDIVISLLIVIVVVLAVMYSVKFRANDRQSTYEEQETTPSLYSTQYEVNDYDVPEEQNRDFGLKLLSRDNCGVTDFVGRITKGKPANVFQFPWMALLLDEHGEFQCGGSLITTTYVLTAAHCLKQNNIISVRLGEVDRNKVKDCNDDTEEDCAEIPQNITLAETIIHPKYKHKRKNKSKLHDIALIRLQEPAVIDGNHNVDLICLPVAHWLSSSTLPNKMTVSGWGLTENNVPADVLQLAELPVLPVADCNLAYSKLLHSTSGQLDENTHICAGGVDAVDSCTGDSGGPLQAYVKMHTSGGAVREAMVQFGMVLSGPTICGEGPGTYLNIASYMDWILDNLS